MKKTLFLFLLVSLTYTTNAQFWEDSLWIVNTYRTILNDKDVVDEFGGSCGYHSSAPHGYVATYGLIKNKSYETLFELLDSKNPYAKLYAITALQQLEKDSILQINEEAQVKITRFLAKKEYLSFCEGCDVFDEYPKDVNLSYLVRFLSSKSTYPVAFSYSEPYPKFQDGEKALKKYIKKNLQYPTIFNLQEDYYKINCEVIIKPNGKLTVWRIYDESTYPKISDSVKQACCQTAKKLIEEMPKWTVGILGGRKVSVKDHISITFGAFQYRTIKYKKLKKYIEANEKLINKRLHYSSEFDSAKHYHKLDIKFIVQPDGNIIHLNLYQHTYTKILSKSMLEANKQEAFRQIRAIEDWQFDDAKKQTENIIRRVSITFGNENATAKTVFEGFR